jgi:type III secretion protein V
MLTRFLSLARHGDIALALLLVAVTALIILPLPPALLDALIAANFCASLLLLMLAIYVPTPLALSTFPSLILFTTLMRLSLGIASTRLILLEAHAGQIIETFGKLVVGGSVAVGIVVFLIITIVQFIVVSKGSERVAEVGARFTLDAMPGKQMSIDADLRAGLIDKVEAKRRRSVLERESQLYGAMDGAMKFVKGDAIAGILIALVNMIAGLAIGVFVKEMELGRAFQLYTLLTVGDGLVSQIPSLFVSISAGIITTRVVSGDTHKENLGSDIAAQIGSQPRAMVLTGVLMLLFFLVPGFPKLQFGALALVVGGVGYLLLWRRRQPEKLTAGDNRSLRRWSPAEAMKAEAVNDSERLLAQPVQLCLAPDLLERLDHTTLQAELTTLRQGLHGHMGLPFPGLTVTAEASLPPAGFRILFYGVQMHGAELPPGHGWCLDERTSGHHAEMQFPLAGTLLPLPAPTPAATMAAGAPAAGDGAAPLLGPERFLVRQLSALMHRYGAELVGIQETQALLSLLENDHPDLVSELQKAVPLTRVNEVLRRLVEEGVSIRNMREIAHALLDWGPREKDTVMLNEYVRAALSRQLTLRYGGTGKQLRGAVLGPRLEALIRASIKQTAHGSFLVIAQEQTQEIFPQLEKLLEAEPRACVLTSMALRRYVKKMIDKRFPTLPVLSMQEIEPAATLVPLATLEVSAGPAE